MQLCSCHRKVNRCHIVHKRNGRSGARGRSRSDREASFDAPLAVPTWNGDEDKTHHKSDSTVDEMPLPNRELLGRVCGRSMRKNNAMSSASDDSFKSEMRDGGARKTFKVDEGGCSEDSSRCGVQGGLLCFPMRLWKVNKMRVQ